MTTARHIVALLQSHIAGDEQRFLSVATQLAAHEARQGHGKLAQELRELVEAAKGKDATVARRGAGPVPIAQPKGELTSLLSARYSNIRLNSMVLTPELGERIRRVLTEQRQQERLRARGLTPRRKILLVGPPGSGKTMTAAVLAGELKLPLFTVLYDGLIGKLMGETASRLRLVFDAIAVQRGVYFFDEFDAVGAQRAGPNDVGEIRRVLNSFLQFIENDDGPSLIVAATNHPELLDKALFRRFDDVITYGLPDPKIARGILESHLATFKLKLIDWDQVLKATGGLSQAEIARAADDAAKMAILGGTENVDQSMLLAALAERKAATF
ncbi:AAA family ATPase [Acetobacter pasteurianus]|uniref:Cell division AAA ATPase FtsH n=2 Tax=Acetobacter pasteurianus TaxID=438 RepID=C7JFA6_ACEP3|nr:ATP-binding protein [Acetobacter pasteurianus]ASC05950.1 ATPase family 2 protein [Acetobacter pasteurianus subsp. pasteurianus]BAI00496.1 cell division AAA ATPase FtsH [Acetobacter pasteurianus IFO 3283-01]BAI03547.1 cell division AAA ATPase FtsH [Acetobacter pasteurianus IFO 3283-03]BAI06592.1 cell division AAA ATPase FtsH [Acetobacter pasteurianus IFO 3283-07]BAI09642.1 cell division AAA ATPase FtsH [Acetobacter pasteurianus IFO 3283-22]